MKRMISNYDEIKNYDLITRYWKDFYTNYFNSEYCLI